MLTYRHDKGSPLTIEEMDGNFKELEERLNQLDSRFEKENIGQLSIEGKTLKIMGSQGTDLGTLLLPSFSIKAQGDWAPGVRYRDTDFVTYAGGLYSCLYPHMSEKWEDEEGCWQKIYKPPKAETSLGLYERETLPQEESLGKLALLMGEKGIQLIFFNGKGWEALQKGEIL